MQEYRIDLNNEWLSTNTYRKFLSLCKGITKNSALGQFIQNEYLKKDKNYQKLNRKNNKQFNLKTKNGIDKLHNFAKIFGGKD